MKTAHTASSQQHTAGPWSLTMGNDRKTPVAFIATKTSNEILSLEAMTAEGRLGFEANARLIAASPDLLAALEETDTHFSAHFGEDVWANSEAAKTIRAAIAQASGASQ